MGPFIGILAGSLIVVGSDRGSVWVDVLGGFVVLGVLYGYWGRKGHRADLSAQAAAPDGTFASPATLVSEAGGLPVPVGILTVGPQGIFWEPAPSGTVAARFASWPQVASVAVVPQWMIGRRLALEVDLVLASGS